MSVRTKMSWGMCASFAAVAVLGLAAQQPATSPNGASTSSSVTVTGCVARTPASPVGTSGSTASSAGASDTKFVLDKAMASSPNSAASSASSYRLDSDDAKLTPHVGHKVEITGTIQEDAAGAATSAGSANMTPRLKVDTVKMLAANCN
jgi:hypothetical protein